MANDGAILLPKDFDASKITLSDPKGPDSKAKTVYMNYSGKKLILQTPEMPTPFGLSKWDNNDGKTPAKYSLDLSFKEKDSHPGVAKFFDVLQEMDRLAIDTARKNKAVWFKGKKFNDDSIENIYTPSIKYAKDKKTGDITHEYPPTFKAALPFNEKENTISTKVYDIKKNKINLLEMENTKGSRVMLIVHCTGIWVSGAGFGLSWRAIQARIKPPTTIKEYAFAPTEEDEQMEEDVDEDEEVPSDGGKKTTTNGNGGNKASTGAQESDEEDEDTRHKKNRSGGGGSNDRDMLEDDDDELDPPPK